MLETVLSAHIGADVENNVTVAYTSDKGLCGGINSTVTKYTRGVLRVTEGGKHQYISHDSHCIHVKSLLSRKQKVSHLQHIWVVARALDMC